MERKKRKSDYLQPNKIKRNKIEENNIFQNEINSIKYEIYHLKKTKNEIIKNRIDDTINKYLDEKFNHKLQNEINDLRKEMSIIKEELHNTKFEIQEIILNDNLKKN